MIETKNEELEDIRKGRIQGIIIRSRLKWAEEGEKPTRYFCNLESRNYVNKVIAKVVKDDGTVVTKQKEIFEEVKHFYKTLYKNQINIQDNEIQILLQSLSQYPKLSVEETNLLNGELTEQEILFVLKKMKNNKSPGSDGFTAEFYKKNSIKI